MLRIRKEYSAIIIYILYHCYMIKYHILTQYAIDLIYLKLLDYYLNLLALDLSLHVSKQCCTYMRIALRLVLVVSAIQSVRIHRVLMLRAALHAQSKHI